MGEVDQGRWNQCKRIGATPCCARAASGNAAADERHELAPFHRLPSSARESHITTPLREHGAVQCGKIDRRMAEMSQKQTQLITESQVRFAPQSGYARTASICPFSAKSRHLKQGCGCDKQMFGAE